MTRFAALGDSITAGMGDPLADGGWRGWATLLGGTLPQAEVHNLAISGALAADVERVQLPAAAALRPDVASVVVGINDTLRGDFDPGRTGAAIGRTVAGLRDAGAQVLTMRLPDPGQMFGLPGALSRPLARRMHAVNEVVDEVARRHGTLHLDIARDPATYQRHYWSVDRLHPNERGHRFIACRFHALLAASGYAVGPGPDPEPSGTPPTRLAEARWMATKGTAWLIRRSRDLVPALVGLAVREWLGLEDPEPESTEPEYPGLESTGMESTGMESTDLDGTGREPVNLNALSRRSGNLELYERFPLARLKVRNRVSGRNEGTKPYHGTDLRARPMSQNYDPNYPGHGQGYLAGPDYAGGPGYPGGYQGAGFGAPPPPPPRRGHKRGLIITGAVALAAGAAAGGLIGSMNKGVVSTATATSNTVLSASQIAQRVDPALVDIVATDGDQQATSAGTGIVLTATGEILTNNHVIRGATSIKVTDVGNGKTYTASIVGYDANDDVAVIQLKNASGLTTASLGDSSSVASGDTVTALGNAGGKGGTPSVASGTVTALGQSITASDEGSGVSEQLTGLIQTNADIQPGDSGGALVNSHGQVIGMNTAASTGFQFQGQSSSQGSQVQAYAIPIDSALTIAKQIEGGNASSTIHIGATAFLGIETSGSDSSGASGFGGFGGQGTGQASGTGVAIVGALSGSPAASAGLTQGDTITAVGGQSVSSASDIQQVLVKYHPGDKIAVSWQDASGQSHSTTVTLTSGPAA